jgi:hypothetical protein
LAVYLILQAAAFLISLVFAPVVWLNAQHHSQRVRLRHHDG